MGFLSKIFGGGGSGGSSIQQRPDYAFGSGTNLMNWADTQAGKYPYEPAKPYGRQMTPDRNKNQNVGQGILSGYLQSNPNQYLNTAGMQLTKTAEGGYDPYSSPEYQAFKARGMKEAQDAVDAIRHQSAVSGHLYSDPRLMRENQVAENLGLGMNQIAADLYSRERDRQTNVLPQLVQLGQFTEGLPIAKATAAESIGGIPYQQEQSALDRMYNEYLRQVEGARAPYDIYEGLTTRRFDPYESQPLYTGGTGEAQGMGQIFSMFGG